MKIKNLPKAAPAIETGYLRNLGIQAYDADNLYPQNVRNIVLNSKTGASCLERFRDYIEGRGIASEILAGMQVNLSGETLADLHALVSDDLATLDGYAIHVNYDVNARIVSLHHIPFENARLKEPDEEGVVRQVALHPDWSGKLTRNGKPVKIDRSTVDFIDVFNPDPEIVRAQMAEAGGPQFYKGQVLYYSTAGYLRYPFAKYHAVLPDMSTDEGLSNIMNRNVRNNFLPAGAFVRLKGQTTAYTDENGYEEADTYSDDLAAIQGDTNALKIMDITVETKEEMPEFVNMQGNNYDKEFTATAAEVKDCIYSEFGQEGWLSLRNGKVGFSGTLIGDMERDYARRQVKTQKALTQAYVRLLSYWSAPLPATADRETLRILPIVDITSTPTV